MYGICRAQRHCCIRHIYCLTDVASRKRLVESFVKAVFVYDDKAVFTFNYKVKDSHHRRNHRRVRFGFGRNNATDKKRQVFTCLFFVLGIYQGEILRAARDQGLPATKQRARSREGAMRPNLRRGVPCRGGGLPSLSTKKDRIACLFVA